MKLIGKRSSRKKVKKKKSQKQTGKKIGLIIILLLILSVAALCIWLFRNTEGLGEKDTSSSHGEGNPPVIQQPVPTPDNQITPTENPPETSPSEITPTPIPIPDTPPVFEGLRTIESMKGVPIMYRRGVSAYDGLGRPLDFEIDSSNVDLNTIGEYIAIFSAEDNYGHKTDVEVKVLILEIDVEWVNDLIDGVLNEILTDSMTQVDQAKAIFTWIKSNVSFTAMAAAPQSAYEGAYRALQDRRGGCTIFSSLSYVMLTRAEIPNLRIDRVPEAPTRHRWNLINPDGLGWYHFDAFPILLGGPRDELYMFTASHAANFTRQMTSVDGVAMYYVYDPELYPEIVYE